MATIDDKQIDKMMADIASIKAVIDKNQGLFRDMLLPQHFRVFSLYVGIALTVFSVVFYVLQIHYHTWGAVPQPIKTIFYSALAVCWALAGFLKWSLWGRGMSKINSSYSVSRAMEQFFSFRLVHIYLPLVAIGFILGFYFFHNNMAYYIIPVIAIPCGLMYNLFGTVVGSRQWLVGGYWFLISGVCLLLISHIPGPIAVAISLGGGCLAFALVPDREASS
jgi:hypothetical protein